MAEALRASVRYEAAYTERVRYSKAYYSLDADDGIEYSACLHELTPDEVLELKVVIRQLWNLSHKICDGIGNFISVFNIMWYT